MKTSCLKCKPFYRVVKSTDTLSSSAKDCARNLPANSQRTATRTPQASDQAASKPAGQPAANCQQAPVPASQSVSHSASQPANQPTNRQASNRQPAQPQCTTESSFSKYVSHPLLARGIKAACFDAVRFLTIIGHDFSHRHLLISCLQARKMCYLLPPHPQSRFVARPKTHNF